MPPQAAWSGTRWTIPSMLHLRKKGGIWHITSITVGVLGDEPPQQNLKE